jgi:hypothetical protein
MSSETTYDCTTVDERLLDYLYDELPEGEEKRIEEHLAGCARCRAEVAGFRRVRQAARALPVAEPSSDVSLRLLEAARVQVQGGEVGLAAAAAAAVAAPPLRLVASNPAPLRAEARPQSMTPAEVAPAAKAAVPAAASNGAAGATPLRRRGLGRVLRHPGFAVAASFLFVGAGTMYLVAEHRAVEPMAMAPVPSSAIPPASAPALAEGQAEAEAGRVAKNVADKPVAVPVIAAEQDERATAGKADPVKERLALREEPAKAPRPAPPLGLLDGTSPASGQGAATIGPRGDVATATSHARARTAPAAEPAPPPPAPRNDGHGTWLGKDENEQLARSIGHGTTERGGGGAAASASQPAPATISTENYATAQKADREIAGRAQAEAKVAHVAEKKAKKAEEHEQRPAAADDLASTMAAHPEPTPTPAAAVAAAPPPTTPAVTPPPAAPLEHHQAAHAPPLRTSPTTTGGLAATIPEGASPALQQAIGRFNGAIIAARMDGHGHACVDVVDNYRAIQTLAPRSVYVLTSARLNVAECMAYGGDFNAARLELATIRRMEPDQAEQVDRRLRIIDQLEAKQQLAHRRAKEAPVPATAPPAAARPAAAAPAKASKAKPAAAETNAFE